MSTTIKRIVSVLYRARTNKYEVQAWPKRMAGHVLSRCIIEMKKKQEN